MNTHMILMLLAVDAAQLCAVHGDPILEPAPTLDKINEHIVLKPAYAELENESQEFAADIDNNPIPSTIQRMKRGENSAGDSEGFFENNGIIYKLGSEIVTFDVARGLCQEAGMDLATIDSEEKDLFITGVLNNYGLRMPEHGNRFVYWMGARRDGDGQFRWLHTNQLVSDGYTQWYSGEPNNFRGNEDCLNYWVPISWNDIHCNVPQRYICQYYPSFFINNGIIYKLGSEIVTFDEARGLCQGWGMSLATIDSEEKDLFIRRVLSNYGLRMPEHGNGFVYWMGARRDGDGQFRWLHTNKLVSDGYTQWHSAEPNNFGGNEDCLHYWVPISWNDIRCNLPQRYICEYDYSIFLR